MKSGKLLTLAAALLLVCAMAAVAEEDDTGLIGNPAPLWTVPGFDGGDLNYADFQGKVVMVVFWFPT